MDVSPPDPDPAAAGLLARLERGCDRVFEGVAQLCGWVLVAMALAIAVDIVLRELRTAGLIGFNWQFVAEWSTYLLIFVVFAGLAYTLRSDGHITVSLLVRRFPPRVQSALAFVMAVISEVVLVYMVYRAALWMQISLERGITSTSVIKTPMWIPNLFVVFGLALFAVAVLLFALRAAVCVVQGRPPGTAA